VSYNTLNEHLLGGNPVHFLVLFCFVTFVDFIFETHVFLQEVSPKRVKSHSSEKVVKSMELSRLSSLKRARLSAFDDEILAQASFTSKNGFSRRDSLSSKKNLAQAILF